MPGGIDNNERVVRLVLEENGLYKKRIPEGRNSLMKAISDSLFFTTRYHDRLQSQSIEHLKLLVENNELSQKLNHFRANSYLFKDYCDNPSLPGFENINLELISLIYKVQIKVYQVNFVDLTLNATIVNNKHRKKVELFKNVENDSYDTIYPSPQIKVVAHCQNIIFNLLNGVQNNDFKWRNINNHVFINIEYENWAKKMLLKKKNTNEESRVSKQKHKKSLSDDLNKIALELNKKESYKEPFDIFGSYRDDMLANLTLNRRKSSTYDTSILAGIEKNYSGLLENNSGVWPSQSPINYNSYLQSPAIKKNLSNSGKKFVFGISEGADKQDRSRDLQMFLAKGPEIVKDELEKRKSSIQESEFVNLNLENQIFEIDDKKTNSDRALDKTEPVEPISNTIKCDKLAQNPQKDFEQKEDYNKQPLIDRQNSHELQTGSPAYFKAEKGQESNFQKKDEGTSNLNDKNVAIDPNMLNNLLNSQMMFNQLNQQLLLNQQQQQQKSDQIPGMGLPMMDNNQLQQFVQNNNDRNVIPMNPFGNSEKQNFERETILLKENIRKASDSLNSMTNQSPDGLNIQKKSSRSRSPRNMTQQNNMAMHANSNNMMFQNNNQQQNISLNVAGNNFVGQNNMINNNFVLNQENFRMQNQQNLIMNNQYGMANMMNNANQSKEQQINPMMQFVKSQSNQILGLEDQAIHNLNIGSYNNPNTLSDEESDEKKAKPVILDESRQRFTGRLKFFDEVKNFGFIIMDNDGGDIFVHYDDLSKANLPKEFLRTAKKGNIIRLSFSCLKYIGKHNRSRKAVDVQQIS